MDKIKKFWPCYYAFLANGMMALVLGIVLPYLIEEIGINYSVAGSLLSAFAIGNFLASFINPILVGKIGRKKTTVGLTLLIPVSLGVISFCPPVYLLFVFCLLLGIGRGTVSIVNNMVVNDHIGTTAALNLLHTVFAVGAFTCPLLATYFIGQGMGWRAIVYLVMILCFIAWLGYMRLPLEEKVVVSKKNKGQDEKQFLKNMGFYTMGGILFFYLGVENCVNGWFITYFKSMGIMSDQYATNLISITWLVIMVGRLLTAYLSSRVDKKKLILMNCSATAIFFVLLISTQQLLWITVAIIGLGFFFAGIYPTSVACGGEYIKGSTLGMSLLLGIAALGGIITPQIVGMVADALGMIPAIMILVVNVICMVCLAVINSVRKPKILEVIHRILNYK
ncbi:MAG: MFS transporter [Cellulosilyticum sp.]|nr:MFS transporter [Cellulosilyticum sp.]